MSISIRPLPGTSRDPRYPDSDGEPMAETEFHLVAIIYLYEALKRWYRLQDDVYVAGNMLLYYEEGNPRAFRGPDVMVSKGVQSKHPRRSFRTWEEGVAPTVIIEVTSKKTCGEDEVEKPPIYAGIGVKELYLFDPEGEYLRPRLKGFQLREGQYVPMSLDAEGQLFSPELGLRLAIDEHLLRLIDPATGAPLPTDEEQAEELFLAERRAEDAAREANEARREAEIERRWSAKLEAELARLRAARPADETGRA
jgi:Uma2 family endonuclease